MIIGKLILVVGIWASHAAMFDDHTKPIQQLHYTTSSVTECAKAQRQAVKEAIESLPKAAVGTICLPSVDWDAGRLDSSNGFYYTSDDARKKK